MKDNFNINLKKVIPELPKYEPGESLWNKISGELDFDEKISNKIKDISTFNHENDLWDRVEKRLNQQSKMQGKKIRRMITWSISIAASMAIIVLFFTRKSGTSDIVFSEEYQLKESFMHISNSRADDPVDLLKQLCVFSMDKCTDPAFETEMNRLVELDADIKHIHKIIHAYGESPSLIKSLIIMENQKAGLVKELLKIVRT